MEKLVAAGCLCLALAGVASVPAATRAAPKEPPVMAVFLTESKGSPLSGDEVSSLSDYLSSRLGEEGAFQVLPRSEIRSRLGPAAARELDGCHEPVCQHHLSARVGARYALSSWVGKVGSQCLLVADVLDTTSNLLVRSVQTRDLCQPEMIIGGFERLAAELNRSFARPLPGVPEGKRRLAVLLPENRGSPLRADELELLGQYLRARLLSAVQVECLPSSALRLQAGDGGPGEPAQLSVHTSVSKIGSQCLLSAALWDLSTDRQIAAVTVREKCDPDRLVPGLEDLADRLAALLQKP
ncbi:MAG TPA: hypothetical protein PK668_08145 [Myxococcota bacterium]|nr:hypothetical protein [Myxococcota bacterium]HRY93054.1 hypothetical protein [Myxococcota bacterium]